jgi:hypothetical protein
MRVVNISKLVTLKAHVILRYKRSLIVHEVRLMHLLKRYIKELESDKQIFTIVINKCRKNILYYGKFDYCIFTVFDKVDEFEGSTIQPDLYYVESDNYMPLRGNGWYYHNMICFCLDNDIIKPDNINMLLNLHFHYQNIIIIIHGLLLKKY